MMVVIVLICVWGLFYLNSSINYFKNSIINIVKAAAEEDYEKANELAEILAIDWTRKEKVLTFVISNKELDEVTFSVSVLESYIGSDYYNELRATCEKMIYILDHIWYFERPSLYNLL